MKTYQYIPSLEEFVGEIKERIYLKDGLIAEYIKLPVANKQKSNGCFDEFDKFFFWMKRNCRMGLSSVEDRGGHGKSRFFVKPSLVCGIPGSGKAFSAKREIINLFEREDKQNG